MATTLSYAVEALSQLGLPEALIRRREDGFELHHAAFTLQAARALVTGLMVAAAAPAAAWWFAEPRLVPVLLALSAITALNGFENVGLAEYRRAMRFDVQVRLQSITRLAGFVTTIGSALLGMGYWALLAGIAVSSVTRVAWSYRLHPFRPRLRLTRWRELVGFSAWTWATAVASLVWDRCDPFVLGPVVGPAKLGLYLLAMEIAYLPVTELVAPVADALFAAFARAQKDGVSSVHHAPQVASIVLLAVVPVVLSVSAASGPIVEVLLGPKWAAAWPVVAVLSWGCVFSPFSYICSMALVANRHLRRNFIANVAVSIIKLAVLLGAVALTDDLVTIGALTAACIATESVLFLLLLRGTGMVRLRPAVGGIARVVLAAGLAAAAIAVSGLSWHGGAGSVERNLLQGVAIGAMATSTVLAGVAALWLLAGRPQGAETRLVELGRASWPRQLRGRV